MTHLIEMTKRGIRIIGAVGVAVWLAGCGGTRQFDTQPAVGATSGGTTNPLAQAELSLRPNERLTITFSDVNPPLQPFEGRIREDGKITLMENQEFAAAGMTAAELEKAIRERYVPNYYVKLTATVRAETRFFYVYGQVRSPNRWPYEGDITVLGAIAAAGGFTEFAQPRKVQVTRANNKIEIINCIKAKDRPALDVKIYPNDRIDVPRRIW